MAEARFWDTSALVKVFDAKESDHRRARGLWSGPRSRRVRHVSSILVAIEAVRRFYRSVPDEVGALLDALDAVDLVFLDDKILPVAFELAKHSKASGADTAIVASAVALKRYSGKQVELVTADQDQATLASREGIEVVQLSL